MMLQLRPLFEVGEARTHIPGFEPCIASAQAAVGLYLTGRAFVAIIRLGFIDSALEEFPSFFHRAGTEIIARDRKGGAEVWSSLRVAYQSACSLQHGQRVTEAPMQLLRKAGFSVTGIGEPHICCGSAGTYNILQPELSAQLRERKAANIARAKPEVVSSGNIGCMTQLAPALDAPIVHTIELLDWAYGGPCPRGLERFEGRMSDVPLGRRAEPNASQAMRSKAG